MGAHGTLEEALNNVANFRSASRTDQSVASKSSGKSSKHTSHKKRKKSKDKIKEKKEKSKKHKKQRRSSSPSSSEEDDVDLPADLQTQLAKGRESARLTRGILAAYPDMRSDLRKVHGVSLHLLIFSGLVLLGLQYRPYCDLAVASCPH